MNVGCFFTEKRKLPSSTYSGKGIMLLINWQRRQMLKQKEKGSFLTAFLCRTFGGNELEEHYVFVKFISYDACNVLASLGNQYVLSDPKNESNVLNTKYFLV